MIYNISILLGSVSLVARSLAKACDADFIAESRISNIFVCKLIFNMIYWHLALANGEERHRGGSV